MTVFRNFLTSNASLGYIASMRNLLSLPSLFSILPLTTYASSYHDNVGNLQYVNPKIGTYGITPNGNGGMIPSVSPPFGMTRWTPQTRENFISQCPYNDLDQYIHGFQATHQPAIWMGESVSQTSETASSTRGCFDIF